MHGRVSLSALLLSACLVIGLASFLRYGSVSAGDESAQSPVGSYQLVHGHGRLYRLDTRRGDVLELRNGEWSALGGTNDEVSSEFKALILQQRRLTERLQGTLYPPGSIHYEEIRKELELTEKLIEKQLRGSAPGRGH